MKLHLPTLEDESWPLTECRICGAKPEGPDPESLQFRNIHDGIISMSVDRDLCLECAIHFWRALKYNLGTQFDAIAGGFIAWYLREAVEPKGVEKI